MQKSWVIVLNVFILLVVALFLTLVGWRSLTSEEIVPEECIDVNKVASFVYDVCYDSYSQTIFISVDRSPDSYNLKSFDFYFSDGNQQVYNVDDVPNVGTSRAYKISSDRNPETLSVKMNIVKDFSAPICEEPRYLYVKYCPNVPDSENIEGEISPFSDVSPDEFLEIGRPFQESDIFEESLVEKEAIWESACKSDWKCGEWEACENGVQKRSCVDNNDCYVPTQRPETVKYCDGICKENWECTWSSCSNGYTTPDCEDLNDCGTTFNLPEKLPCNDDSSSCVPDVVCSEWSECDVNYNFLDLVGGSISDLSGSRSRICEDKNKCSSATTESKECSVNIDIYTKRFVKCGKEYIGVYNSLNNELIARIDIGTEGNPSLNLFLDNQASSEYCDYCFNGVMDGDESGIDCGGGCMGCDEKYGDIDYDKGGFLDWLFGIS